MKSKVLVADDNLEKQNAIMAVLESSRLELDFFTSHSYNSTIKTIKNEKIDIILLDMSMPTFDANEKTNSTIKPLSGRDVLSKLKYKKSNAKVLVITQFDVFGRMNDTIELSDLELNLQDSFPNNFYGCIYYDPSGSSWREKLISLVKGILKDE